MSVCVCERETCFYSCCLVEVKSDLWSHIFIYDNVVIRKEPRHNSVRYFHFYNQYVGKERKSWEWVILVGVANEKKEARAAVEVLGVDSCTVGVNLTIRGCVLSKRRKEKQTLLTTDRSSGLFVCVCVCLLLELIVVIVDISSVSVRTGVTRADWGVFIKVVLTSLVSGASLVHPVRQVSLQPLVKKKNKKKPHHETR